MKKLFLFGTILLAGALLSTAQAGKKKDKDKKAAAAQPSLAVALTTTSDSMSYAAGYAATQGLETYLQRQLGVDTAYMADFVRGYREAVAKSSDPAYTAYMAGTNIARQAASQIFPGMGKELAGTPDSLTSALFHEGFLAGVQGDTAIVGMEQARSLYETHIKAITEAKNAAYKAENEAWLKDNATKSGVVTLPSGLQYKVLTAGTGAKPTAEQTVEVVYEGKMIDGTVFDATSRHNGQKTDKFECNRVIKGWTEALTNMPVGSKWEIYIPQEPGYGERAAGQIKPYSTLIFTVELVGIEAPEAAADKAEAVPTKAAAAKTAKGKGRRK